MSIRPGTPFLVALVLSLIRPASMTVWPFCTDTELLTRRCDTVGVSVAVAVAAMELICCSISMETTPLAFTRGRTFRMMPVSLYSTLLTTAAVGVSTAVAVRVRIGTWSPTCSTAACRSDTTSDGEDSTLTLVTD